MTVKTPSFRTKEHNDNVKGPNGRFAPRLLFTSSATEIFMVEHLSEQAVFAKRRKRLLIRSIIVDVRCATTILASKKSRWVDPSPSK